MPRLAANWIAKSLIRGTSFARQHRNLISLGLGASMTDDLEKLINKALLQWKAREISLHFHGRKNSDRGGQGDGRTEVVEAVIGTPRTAPLILWPYMIAQQR